MRNKEAKTKKQGAQDSDVSAFKDTLTCVAFVIHQGTDAEKTQNNKQKSGSDDTHLLLTHAALIRNQNARVQNERNTDNEKQRQKDSRDQIVSNLARLK
jgi:hypothetical protein